MIKEGSIVPRKGYVAKREVMPDPIYKDIVITKLINSIMLDGKKGKAQKIVYNAFDQVAEAWGEDALEARRVGGATYQVPMEVRPERRETIGLRWLTIYSRKRGEKNMVERLAKEILDASNETGASVKKREEVHKMAEANKAFAHYRW